MGLQEETIVCARLKGEEISSLASGISDNPQDFVDKLAALSVPKGEVQGIKLADYIWELISHNAEAIGIR